MVFNSVVVILLLQLVNKVNGYYYKSYQNKIIKNYNHQNHFVSSSSSRSKLMSSPPYKGPDSTPILDTINTPSDMKKLSLKQLKQLSHELRWDTINSVSQVGGHLGSSLGVIELTVALHYVFDAPEDKIIWDVAHQAYPHKILTGNDDNDDDNDDDDSDDHDDNDDDNYSDDDMMMILIIVMMRIFVIAMMRLMWMIIVVLIFMIIKVILMMMMMMMMTRFFSLGRRQRMSTLRQLHGLSGKLYVLFL